MQQVEEITKFLLLLLFFIVQTLSAGLLSRTVARARIVAVVQVT